MLYKHASKIISRNGDEYFPNMSIERGAEIYYSRWKIENALRAVCLEIVFSRAKLCTLEYLLIIENFRWICISLYSFAYALTHFLPAESQSEFQFLKLS